MAARVLVVVFLLAVAGAIGFVLLSGDEAAAPVDVDGTESTEATADSSAPSGALRPDGPSYDVDPAAGSARRATASDDAARPKPPADATRTKEKLGDAAIRGRIRERTTGRAVVGARIAVVPLDGRERDEWTATSDADGAFAIDGVPHGDLIVGVRVPDGRTLVGRRRVTLARGESHDLGDLEAVPGVSIRGRAVENDTGAPVPRARVVAFQPDAFDTGDGGRHVVDADGSGQFELPGPFGPGPVVMSASAPGRKTRPPYPSVHVAPGIDAPEVVVPLARAQSLRGVVLDEDRRGVQAQIEVVGQGRRVCCFDTDPSGAFTIDDVVGALGLARPTPTTELQVKVQAPAFVSTSRTLRLAQLDDTAPHELRVARGASVAGRCVDVSGSPIRDVRVRLYPPTLDRHARLREATSRSDGSFRFDGLEPGEFAIEADTAGKLTPRTRRTLVTLDATTSADGIELVFAAGLPIAGSAATAAFAPLAGRIVTLHHAEWVRPRITRTTGDGSYRFDAVPEGTYTLALRGHELRERRVPTVLRDVAAGSLDNRFVVDEQPADGRIELRIVDATDGRAVTAATQVRLLFAAFGYPQDVTFELRPDATGVVSLDGLERADYTLVVAAAGFAPETVRCVLDESRRESTSIVQVERPVPLFGVVTDAGGLPIQDARVRAFVQRVPGAFTLDTGATTDAGGRFHLADAPPRATVVCAVAPGFAPGMAELDTNAKLLGSRILLRPGARIEGTARFADGSPALDVTLRLDGAIARQFATTDSSGRFTFDDVEDGTFVLALASGDELGSGTIDAAQGLVLDVEIPAIDEIE